MLFSLAAVGWLGFSWATAAEPEFVGVLALAVEDDVVTQLGLTDAQKDALLKLIETRENVDALELALQLQDVPAAQRHEKMAPFRRQSELKGLALLTPEQRQKLEQIRIQRVGLATLAEPAIAEKLQLTDPQRAQVAQLLRQGGERLAAAEEKSVHVIRAEVERSLRSVLSDEQWAAWQRLAFAPSQAASLPGEGLAAAEAPPPPPPLELVMNEPAAPAEAEPAPPGEPKTESSDLPETEPAEPSETQPVQAAETAAPERVSTEPSQPVQPPPSDSPGAQPTDAPAPESAGPAEMPPAETSDVGPPAPSAPGLAEPAQPPSPEPSGVQPAGPPETAPVVPPGAEAVMPPGAEAVMPPGAEAVAPPGAEAVAPPGAAPVAPPGAEVPKPSPSEELDWLRLLDTELAAREAEGPVRLRFNFRYQPWEDVLDWVAEQAGLSLLYEDMPKGTCNYVDNREYTVPEALDVLNSLLLIKGYTLVRRERMLVVVNLDEFEDGIPPNLVTMVPVDELDERGEYELVSTVFQLEKITAEEAQAEIEKLLGPQGKIVPLPKAQQIVVTETAGRLRTIRDALQRVEDPEGLSSHQFRSFPLEFTMAEEVLAILRQLFDIPADQNAAPDGSIRLILDPLGMRLIAFGKPSKLEQVAKVLEAIEGPGLGEMETPGVEAALQLEVYNVGPADSQSVLKVIQTLLAGSPGARLSIDEKTGNLIALCRPEDHATIRATMEQLINDASAVDVIQLRSLDPQVAVLSITKLFGGEGSTLKVDADPTTRRLVVRGPKALVEQIRAWLEKMGESEVAEAGVTTGGNVRVLPLSGWAGKSALERLQEIWPTMRQNKIRVVAPGAAIPEMRVSRPGETPAPEMDRLEQLFGLPPLPGQSGIREPASQQLNPQYPSEMPLLEMDLLKQLFGLPPMPEQPEIREPASQQFIPQYPGVMPPPEQVPAEPPETLSPAESPSAGAADAAAKPARVAAPDAAGRGRFMFASDMVAAEPGSEGSTTPQAGAASGESETEQAAPQATPPQPAKEPAPIIVAPGPGGIMIASEDVEALNEFESLLTALASVPMAGTADMTVFYLVHARATLVAEILDAVFGGGTLADGDGSSGRGSLLGDLAGAAFGDAGNLVGSLLGLGGGGSTITASGSIQIIPVSDTRLNALIVRANPTDTETVRQLLEILDQERSPVEVLAQAKPRLIPVSNTLADEMAEVVRQIYQANLSAGSGGGRPPSPQEFLEALRGGRGRGRSSRSATEEVQRMSIGVDARTNSLIVSAPEPLFQEVKLLVETLDQAALGSSNQAVQVVTLKRSNAEAVQKALSSLVGENVTFGRSGSRTSSTSGRPSGPTPPSPGSPMDEFRRQMIMRAMQGGGGPPGFGGGPSPFGGGGGPPGFGGGGFSRAGFGPPGGFGRGGSSRGGGSSGGGRR